MKPGSIPYPREFGPGDVGVDCKAVKRALVKATGSTHGMNVKTTTFAKTAGAVLADWKKTVHLLHTPYYTAEAHEHLQPFFDEYGASLMNRQATRIEALRQRTAYVDAWRWAIAHHALYDYAQVRPIPTWLPPFQTTARIRTDCSGNATLMAKWAKVADPNKFAYREPVEGNTGTLLAACEHIPQSSARAGDLIVYRRGSWDTYGHHVVAILEVLPSGDFSTGSHGSQGNPREVLHSDELRAQAHLGYPAAVFLRWLPPLT